MKQIRQKDRTINIFDNGTRIDVCAGWLEITMPDGKKFNAVPEDNEDYRQRAESLGFVDDDGVIDTWKMCRHHDLSHAKFADILKLKESPSLRAAAEKRPPSELTDAEETFILAFHRYFNLLRKGKLI